MPLTSRACSTSLIAVALSCFLIPTEVRAFIQIQYPATLRVDHAGKTLYNGNPDNPLIEPDPIVINGADLTEATTSWTISEMAPPPFDVQSHFGVYVLMRIDPATGNLEGGVPQRGINYDVVYNTFRTNATSTITADFSMPLLGDGATPSGTYRLEAFLIPDTKDTYDPDTDTDTITPFTLDDLGDWLAADSAFENVFADIKTITTPITFIYHAGAAPQQGCQHDCFSNVLFIPGMESSRLYTKGLLVEDQRWEPTLNDSQFDVKALYLNADGTTINNVYTKSGQAVDEYGVLSFKTDIYKSFVQQLAQMKASTVIGDYAVFPYDWRMSPIDVINKGTSYDDGTRYLEDVLINLAKTSKTGKVTIVGHSNGGLVTKALMNKLVEDGKAGLIDKIIFVDVPQLGTPKAITSMLHGDGQSIALFHVPGLVVSQENARGLGENMPDAYDLLPSNQYFNSNTTPVIDVTSAPTLRAGSDVDSTINSANDFAKFLTTGRIKPAYSDIDTPDLLSPQLLNAAVDLHNKLDSWMPPPGVKVIQIAGWGLDTLAGVKYTEQTETTCSVFPCKTYIAISHTPQFKEDGDGTVIVASESATSSWPTYFINLKNTPYMHATIMAMPTFEDLFALLVSSSSPSQLPALVTTSKPIPSSADKSLILSVHSPVTLDVYDSYGRHTGMAANPNSQSDLGYLEEQIPGSYYDQVGEAQYIDLPANDTYKVIMHGTGTGTFTFESTSMVAGNAQQTISYNDIPVTASTTATINVPATSSAGTLSLDINGDGKADSTLASTSQSTDPLTYDKLIISTIGAMDMGKIVKAQLTVKFTNVGYLINRLDKWEDSDDDSDKDEMHGKGILRNVLDKWSDKKWDSIVRTLIIKKLGKIESYIQKEGAKPSPKAQKGKSVQNDERISADQAAAIINMIEHLKFLINN